jgi:uncharacterized protein YndB with AHSA1/START domain
MATWTRRSVSDVRIIPAPRQTLFDLLADPAMHPRIDGSGTVRDVQPGGPVRLGPNARFGMHMRIALPYRILNRVVEFEEGRVIAWAHFSRAVWRWEFTEVEGGTEVRETFDWSNAMGKLLLRRLARGNAVSMQRSLARLERLAIDGEPGRTEA